MALLNIVQLSISVFPHPWYRVRSSFHGLWSGVVRAVGRGGAGSGSVPDAYVLGEVALFLFLAGSRICSMDADAGDRRIPNGGRRWLQKTMDVIWVRA